MLWGLSPALDFQSEIKLQNANKEINILLIGSADARHILKTIAKSYRYEEKFLNFYVIEPCLEQVGRQLILFSTALEQPKQLGLFEKTHTFMELYGNTLLKPTVYEYLQNKSHQLLNCVTDSVVNQKYLPIFKFDKLKYKERDYLENLLKFWSRSNSIFNIEDQWDKRLRQFLEIRYDSRKGVFDWDYHMRFKDLCKQISVKEYTEWRSTGIAFKWLETDRSKPNLTFAAGIIPFGETFIHHGYLGDILTGPFISYGTECEYFALQNSQIKMNATEITEYNLMQTFNELIFKKPYIPDLPVLKKCANKKTEEKIIKHEEQISKQNFVTELTSIIDFPNVTITYLSFSTISTLHLKEYFKHYFDVIYISHDLYQNINLNMEELVQSNAVIIIETKKFVINKEQQHEDETNTIQNMSKKFNFCTQFNPTEDSFAKMYIKTN